VRTILGAIAIATLAAFLMVTSTHAQVVFTDITEEAGIDLTEWLTESVAWGDFDNDGDLDLYVVNFTGGLDVLYRNDGPVGIGGAYRFTDITLSARTNVERSSRGMTFVDYDRDGLLDIFVMAVGPNILYRNSVACDL